MNLRSIVAILTLLVVLGSVNASIVEKETIVREGESILLRLAPVDPRSLMQGDYMVLRYDLAVQAPPPPEGQRAGKIVISVDEDHVATFERYYAGGELAANEHLLAFKHHKGNWRNEISFGARSFFFEEGSAEVYSNAEYGELRVDAEGNSVLIGLRGEDFEILGEQVVSPDAPGIFVNSGDE